MSLNRFLKHNAPPIVAAIILIIVFGFSAWTGRLSKTLPYSIPEEFPTPHEIIPSNKPPTLTEYTYIKIADSCGPYYNGEQGCVNMREGAGTQYPSALKLRRGMILRTTGTTTTDTLGNEWYKIDYSSEWLRYPERASSTYYVAASVVEPFTNIGTVESTHTLIAQADATGKRILVDISDQTLYAYDSGKLFMQQKVSTGKDLTPTTVGNFIVYRKSPSRYMQGPTPESDQLFDLPGVPWNLYFTIDGGAIHGAYWHNSFGEPWSHGCVNLPPDKAQELYEWAPIGIRVFVQE